MTRDTIAGARYTTDEALVESVAIPSKEYAVAVAMRANGKRVPLPPSHITPVRRYGLGWRVPRYTGESGATDETVLPDGAHIGAVPGFALRDYQRDALAAWWRHKSGIIVAPCGAGKTAMGLTAVLHLDTPALVLVHTGDLLRQWKERAEALGIPTTTIAEGLGPQRARLAIATMQTLALWPRHQLAEWGAGFGLVVVDECFPAGTLIATPTGPKAIESFKVGDLIASFDETTGKHCVSAVAATMRSQSSRLVNVTIDNQDIQCTAGHPFLTKRGWVNASQLVTCDVVRYASNHDIPHQKLPLQAVPTTDRKKPMVGNTDANVHQLSRKRKSSTATSCQWSLRMVQHSNASGRAGGVGELSQQRKNVLLQRAYQCMESASVLCGDGKDKSTRCFCQNDQKQSDAEPGNAGHGISLVTSYRSSSTGRIKRGKRNGLDRATNFACLTAGMANRGSNQDRHETRFGLSKLLQSGHWKPGVEDCYRNRRRIARYNHQPSARREAGCAVEWARVDRVEIQKPSGNGVNRGCTVYNLEIERTHTYCVATETGSVVVHNCHHVPCATLTDVLYELPGRYRLGLTATPTRADGLTPILLGHMGPIRAEVSRQALAEAGAIIVPRVERIATAWTSPEDTEYVQMVTDATEDDARNIQIADLAATAVKAGRHVLIQTERVEHARVLSRLIGDRHGLGSVAVYGGLGAKARALALSQVASGACPILIATQLADEGLDLPILDTLILGVPQRNAARLEQRVGRIARPAPGKVDAIVYDLLDDGPAKRLQYARLKVYRMMGCQVSG